MFLIQFLFWCEMHWCCSYIPAKSKNEKSENILSQWFCLGKWRYEDMFCGCACVKAFNLLSASFKIINEHLGLCKRHKDFYQCDFVSWNPEHRKRLWEMGCSMDDLIPLQIHTYLPFHSFYCDYIFAGLMLFFIISLCFVLSPKPWCCAQVCDWD